MATVSNDVDDIRRQMATIRRAMHEDVKEVVATAEAATDWHRYLTMYPWATLGVGLAVGYWIVPRRHKTADAIAATQADMHKVRDLVESTGRKVVASAKAQAEQTPKKKGLIMAALGLATPMLMKAAQGYAMKYLEQWILQQQTAAMHAGPMHAGGPGPQTGYGMGPGPGPGPGRAPGAPRHPGAPGSF